MVVLPVASALSWPWLRLVVAFVVAVVVAAVDHVVVDVLPPLLHHQATRHTRAVILLNLSRLWYPGFRRKTGRSFSGSRALYCGRV